MKKLRLKGIPLLDLLQVSLAEETGRGKTRERLVILGMLINIYELSSLASIFKMTGLLSTVSSKLGVCHCQKKNIAEPRSVVSLSFLSI